MAMGNLISCRLLPGDDLKQVISKIIHTHKISAGVIVSSVGSLKLVRLRMANALKIKELKTPHEIISLNGTLSPDGCHLHLCVANKKGQLTAGHLVEGNLIFTTCELVLMRIPKTRFNRTLDPRTGFLELIIK